MISILSRIYFVCTTLVRSFCFFSFTIRLKEDPKSTSSCISLILFKNNSLGRSLSDCYLLKQYSEQDFIRHFPSGGMDEIEVKRGPIVNLKQRSVHITTMQKLLLDCDSVQNLSVHPRNCRRTLLYNSTPTQCFTSVTNKNHPTDPDNKILCTMV